MKNAHKFRNMLLITGAIATVSFALPTFASDLSGMPQPAHQGNITYITGGVGDGEEGALRADERAFDLRVTNANTKGQYTVGTNFTITSKSGREMVRVNDAGPLFFVNLMPGEYTVKASSRGQERIRDVKISAKRPTNVHLIWHES